MNSPYFNISSVERDTGLSKDVLRMWERRYGFPVPDRDANGERCYPTEQVERLRLIKRLMDQGHRPGRLIATPADELTALLPRRSVIKEKIGDSVAEDLGELMLLIKQHDAAGYQQAMQQRLARQGLLSFVQDTIAPLTRRVGEAWEDGSFEVFEEHLFTELTKRLLRQSIAALPGGRRGPRILLTSVPDEQHILGLLMIEALFALEGAECIPLGTQMPLLEIARAAKAHGTDIVALSFSVAFPQRQIPSLLQQLSQALGPEISLWAGGGGVARVNQLEGVKLLYTLQDAVNALNNWQKQTPAQPQRIT
jgi:methanogenic corrinoid protein MtbC1